MSIKDFDVFTSSEIDVVLFDNVTDAKAELLIEEHYPAATSVRMISLRETIAGCLLVCEVDSRENSRRPQTTTDIVMLQKTIGLKPRRARIVLIRTRDYIYLNREQCGIVFGEYTDFWHTEDTSFESF